MADATDLDRTYDFILRTFVTDGQAPHYTAIARHFGVAPDEGRQRLHDLMAAGLPNWLQPNTDLIVSFAPFNNLPTQYRITVSGQQKWFAQCGLEALAMTWMFPGRTVRVDAPCLDCGEPLSVAVRDGAITYEEPEGIWFYVDVPFRAWRTDLPFS
jgi:hypothetical protein